MHGQRSVATATLSRENFGSDSTGQGFEIHSLRPGSALRIHSKKALANMTIPRALRSFPAGARSRCAARRAPESSAACDRARRARCALSAAVLALAAGASGAALAAGYPVTPEQRELADQTASRGVLLSELAPGAPSTYTIKRGDTLWAIATLYLKSPWRWPELWGMNREQVRNPHLIYPGQTLELVRTAEGRAQLVVSGGPAASPAVAAAANPVNAAVTASAAPVVRLSPHAREVGAGTAQALPSIPNNLIEPFLSRPQIVVGGNLDEFPRIVSTQMDRVNLGLGDTAYAMGVVDTRVENYNILRPARPLFDPDDADHRQPIGYEAVYLGTARVTKPGDVTTLMITTSKLEIGVGDRLIPVTHQELISYAPHRMEKNIDGRIVSVYEGLDAVGAGSIVTLNRGRNDGLEVGHVVAVLRNGDQVVDHTQPGEEKIRLPDDYVGTAFVFRVFDGLSYALLVSAAGPIQVGDRIGPPDIIPISAPTLPAR
jgi:LysM repeat protein